MKSRESDQFPELAGLGLPDDLPEVALVDVPAPDPASVERIKARTLALALAPETGPVAVMAPRPQSPRTVRRRLPRWAIAVAAVVALAVLAASVPPVAAAVRHLLTFVPGFGVRESSTFSLAAAQTVEVQRAGIIVAVHGLVADETSTVASITVDGIIPLPADAPYLEDAAGRRYASGGGSVLTAGSGSDGWMHAWLSFQPTLPADVRQVTVVIPGAPDWQLTVPLVPAADLAPLEQFGPTATANGVTIAARAEDSRPGMDISLLVQGLPEGTSLASLGRMMSDLPAAREPELITADGRRLPLHTTYSGNGGLYELGTDSAAGSQATVSVPVLRLSKWVSAKARVPVPVTGSSEQINTEVMVGDLAVRLTRVETCMGDDGSPMLKVWVDPGPVETLMLTDLGPISVNGKLSSSTTRLDAETGRIIWFTVGLPSGRAAKIEFTRVELELAGPWEISVPLPK